MDISSDSITKDNKKYMILLQIALISQPKRETSKLAVQYEILNYSGSWKPLIKTGFAVRAGSRIITSNIRRD